MEKIVLYSTGCPMCKILEKKLAQKNVKYQLCNDTEAMMNMGFQSVPMLAVGDKIYNFREAVSWANSL